MKLLNLTVLSSVVAFTHAATLPLISMLPFVLMGVSEPVEGFFGFFRRRQPPKPPVMTEAPQGPVQFIPQGAGSFLNPFANRGGFFPNIQNVPSFPFQMQGNKMPAPEPSQPWTPQSASIPSIQQQFPQSFDENLEPQNLNSNEDIDQETPGLNTEEAESFFTLLAETDENKCISRLVCEMGANPESTGELGQTVNEIIGSLTYFPSGSKVSEYNEVIRQGRARGLSYCLSEYSVCDEETYHLMKNNQPDDKQ